MKSIARIVRMKGLRRAYVGVAAALGAAVLSLCASSGALAAPPGAVTDHVAPEWFRNAKLGIFIHWGVFSVPAWAPPRCGGDKICDIDYSKFDAEDTPYAEWYLNSLRISGSRTSRHHVETYGKKFDYYDFIDDFERLSPSWKPDDWAALFASTGARYVIMVTKHHDGYRLWPSGVPNRQIQGRDLTSRRDLVGEVSSAVRRQGMKMGLYYSSGLDWSYTKTPMIEVEDFPAVQAAQPQDYANYIDAQMRELITRYKPSILWNDINYPKIGSREQIIDFYYRTVPDGAVNDRFGNRPSDFTTPEYKTYNAITPKKWETTRGIGDSFGYNLAEGEDRMISVPALIKMFVDVVSKNGNLLLNVGPRADGSIPSMQRNRLEALGTWLKVNGEAMFDTVPWIRAEGRTGQNYEVRFTQAPSAVYATLLMDKGGTSLTLKDLRLVPGSSIDVLGGPRGLLWRQVDGDVVIDFAREPAAVPVVLRLTPSERADPSYRPR